MARIPGGRGNREGEDYVVNQQESAYIRKELKEQEAEDKTFLKLDGSRPMEGDIDMDDYDVHNINAINFTLNPTHTHTEGGVHWDPDDKCLNVDSEQAGVALQVGQEQWIRVVNKTGSDITNGQVVYISGAQGNRPTIALADSDSLALSHNTIGLATHDIANNANGYVTTYGLARDIDASGTPVAEVWAEGDVLWLSSTAGAMTNVKPVSPKHQVRIGLVTNNSATEGVVHVNVDIGTDLEGTHDVLITSIADNQALIYDNASSLWKNEKITCSIVDISKLGNPTYTTQCEFNTAFGSAGRHTGGTISDAGGATIDVAAGTGFIKAADVDTSELLSFNWAASTGISIPSDTVRYVGVEYNSGSPQVVVKTSYSWDLDTEFPLGQVVNEGGTLHILNNPWWVTDGLTNIIERIQAEGAIIRDQFVGGLALSVTGTRNVAITAGQLWARLNEFPIAALDTSVSGSFKTTWYNGVAGTWNDSSVSQYPVTEYNNTSLATLQTMTANWYANWWVYVDAEDGEVTLVYPQAQYAVSASAEAESPPTLIPTHVSDHGILIGRILFRKSVDAPVEVQSAFTTVFTPSLATDHGSLAGLGDDDHTQYLLASGTRALTADWDAGNFEVRAQTFESDVATGTAPFTIASTTVSTNLNADLLDGSHAADFAVAAKGVTNGDSHDHSGGDGAQIDHGGLAGLTDDDHTQYARLAGRSGGQTLIGGTAASQTLTLQSTSNATRGKVILGAAGTSAYDEVNDRLGIGTGSPTYKLAVFANSNSVVPQILYSNAATDVGTPGLVVAKVDNNSTTSQIFARFYINSATTGSGQINANGASQAAFGTFSDGTLKENIVDLPPQLENICALRPVEFDYKDGSGHQLGFVAQEMQEVYPDAIGLDAESNKLTITGWSKTEARLVKAIQDQQKTIENLVSRIQELEAKLP